MAKRVKLNQAFTDPDETDTVDQEAEAVTPAPTAAKKAAAKKTAKRATKPAKKAASSARRQASGPAAAERPVWATDEAVVLATDTKSAKVSNLYLHPDDHRALELAKLDDDADRQARVRAMIALWRADDRFRRRVDELAKTAPRGGY